MLMRFRFRDNRRSDLEFTKQRRPRYTGAQEAFAAFDLSFKAPQADVTEDEAQRGEGAQFSVEEQAAQYSFAL